jgi:hypothetical protein
LVEGKHTGPLIAKKLDMIIGSLDLTDDVFKVVTADNASNMRVATRKESQLLDLGLGCFDHTLQLVVNKSMEKTSGLQAAVAAFTKLSSNTHKSTLYQQRIKKECGDLNKSNPNSVKYIQIITPVDTRWNSILMMMRSICQLKPALENIREDDRAKPDCPKLMEIIPSEEQFTLIETIIPILNKFETLSDFMSGDKYPTVCHVISKLSFLINYLVSVMVKKCGTPAGEISEHMVKDLEDRFPKGGCLEKAYAYTQLLHPCFRGNVLSDHGLLKSTMEMFVIDNEAPIASQTERPNLDEGGILEVDSGDEDAYFQQKSQRASKHLLAQDRSSSLLKPQTPLESELARFTHRSDSDEVPHNVDVLGWWKFHEKVYPLLAKAVKKYFAIQATSCSSERTFSTGSNTVSCRRTKLDPENVHMLVFCKDNLKKIDFKLARTILEADEEKDEEEVCEAEEVDLW